MKKVLKWVGFSIVIAYAALVVYRMFYLRNEAKTKEQIAKIHATKLSLDDVTGKNLPPDPGALADKTIAGIDANRNNIRDDVELAIFKQYPASAKTRAVLLQYALALQMEVTQPMVNLKLSTFRRFDPHGETIYHRSIRLPIVSYYANYNCREEKYSAA